MNKKPLDKDAKLQQKLNKAQQKKGNGVKILIILWVIIAICVISIFITDDKKEEDQSNNETKEEIKTELTLNGVRFTLPCPAGEVDSADTTIQEKIMGISSFDIKEYVIPQMDVTYKVMVGYLNELPPSTVDFTEAEKYIMNNLSSDMEIEDEEEVQGGGVHYILHPIGVKSVTNDVFIYKDGTFIHTSHSGELGSPTIANKGEERTAKFDDPEGEYTQWNKEIDWVSVIDSAIKDKKAISILISTNEGADVVNWEEGSKVQDGEYLSVENIGLCSTGNCLAYNIAIENRNVDEQDGHEGYIMGGAFALGIQRGDSIEWLNDANVPDLVDIRYTVIPKGEKVNGYALFEKPKDLKDDDKYVIRFYKKMEAGGESTQDALYVDGTGDVIDATPLTVQ